MKTENHDRTQEPLVDKVEIHDDTNRRRRKSEILVDIGKRHQLFTDLQRNAWARIDTTEARCIPIDSAEYRHALSHQYFELTQEGADTYSLGDAINTLSAYALFRGETNAVHLRVAEHKGALFIDQTDRDGTVIKVSDKGWETSLSTPVQFRSSPQASALPPPASSDADFSLLWDYINVEPDDRPLLAAWICQCFEPHGPHPVCVLNGEQGSGKSTAARLLRSLTDPSSVPLRPVPTNHDEFLIECQNSWLVLLDNVSTISAQMSDAVCRVATGTGLSKRRLYTDSQQVVTQIQRPILLNGIGDFVQRPDLLDRSLIIRLRPIATSSRRTIQEIEAGFTHDAPKIFGGVLNALAEGLRVRDTLRLNESGRMADFEHWGAACASGFGYSKDVFISAYRQSCLDSAMEAATASPVVLAIQKFMSTRTEWHGPCGSLREELKRCCPESDLRSALWLKSPRAVSSAIERAAPLLRKVGIEYDRLPRSAAGRSIRLQRAELQSSQPSQRHLEITRDKASDDYDGHDDALDIETHSSSDDSFEEVI